MIEMFKNLYIGTVDEYIECVRYMRDFKTVIAAKEPYHREYVGYKTRGCPKDSPQYYIAKMESGIICNLVDADKKEFIPDEIMIPAVNFIRKSLAESKRVFVCCNQGKSRSPMIAMLSMANTSPLNSFSFEEAHEKVVFSFPFVETGKGIYEYAKENWEKFKKDEVSL